MRVSWFWLGLAAVGWLAGGVAAQNPVDPVKVQAVAQFNQGMRLLESEGSSQQVEQGTALITASANAGYPDAQLFLGLVNEKPQPAVAAEWYRKAAEQGQPRAANRLARLLESGQLGAKDLAAAAKWHRVAAEGGNGDSAYRLAVAELEGRSKDLTGALKWLQVAANDGHDEAQVRLGDLYFNGEGVVQNRLEAYKHYRNAGLRKNVGAYFKLGYCYERGQGVAQSYAEALKWYQRGVEEGDAKCLASLARIYENGLGVARNPVRAADLYRQAAESGDAFAQLSLGSLYRVGQGVEADLVEAYKWIGLAAAKGQGVELLQLLEKQLTPAQVAEGRKRIAEFTARPPAAPRD